MLELFLYQMLASSGYVLFRSLQQLNTYHSRYFIIFPTSLCIAVTEVYVIKLIADSHLPDYLLILSAGTGGALGCYLAMYVSNKLKRGSV